MEKKARGRLKKNSINGIAFYILTLTNREAKVSWPALSTEEALEVSFTQAPVAAAVIFTDICSCC